MELDRDDVHLQPLLDTTLLGLFEKSAEGLSAGKSEAAPPQYCLVQVAPGSLCRAAFTLAAQKAVSMMQTKMTANAEQPAQYNNNIT